MMSTVSSSSRRLYLGHHQPRLMLLRSAIRCLTTSATSQHLPQPPIKLGLGGQNWSRLEPQKYQTIVKTALEAGMDVLEAGQEGGDAALASVLKELESSSKSLPVLTAMARLGYRSLSHDEPDVDAKRELGDITVETQRDALNEDEDDPKIITEVVHNMSQGFVKKTLEQSPLVQLKRENNNSDFNLVYMVHNPEVQTDASDPDVLLEKLVDSFCGLEQAVAEGHIDSFGVVSNGLSLPPDHPLYLSWRSVVLEAAARAVQEVRGTSQEHIANLSTLQLPMNALETTGIQVARDVQQHLSEGSHPHLPKQLNIYAMRPLTCYINRGTGMHPTPFRMIDYPIPMGDKIMYTNEMEGPPPTYQKALNEALSHFDGTALLEAKEERDLTVEEKETLEGCRLLQSIIHDLDVGLEKVTNFAEHEDELVSKVIPIIYGHFEEFDEESSDVLQHFFHAHGLAVRQAISKHMREMLTKGTDKVKPYDIPQDIKLQEFALDHLLKEDCVTRVIVGCSHPIQVLEHAEAARSLVHGASQT